MDMENDALLRVNKRGESPRSNQEYPSGDLETITASVPPATTGLGVLTAAVFLVGEMAGGGVLALPGAVDHAGWSGLVLILVGCVASGVNGVTLGKCWMLLLERYPDEFQGKHISSPYPAIGEKAVGKWMSVVVSVAMDFTLFGAATVFLTISAQNIESLLRQAGVHLSFCYLLIILTCVLIPALWLGSPKDFWPLAVGAAICTGIACVLIVTRMCMDLPGSANPPREVTMSTPSFQSLFLGYGAIVFAFGGASCFPTVQQDMKRPEEFDKVVIAAYAVLLAFYIPVATGGYVIYGDQLENNILQNLPHGGIRVTVEILMTLHFLFAIVIALNPFSQDLESLLRVPQGFNWRRCLVRTALILCALFTAESIPHFGALLDLIGGSSVSFMTFVAPSLFYMRLTSQKGDWPDRPMSLHMKVLCCEMMAVGVVGGVASTISAIGEITSPSTFIPPCYVNITAASPN